MIKVETIILVLSLLLSLVPLEMLPSIEPAHKLDIYYPARWNIKLPYPLYISDLLPVGENDGLLMIGSSWSPDLLLGRQVMIRLAKDDSLRWYYASEISPERKEWYYPVSLGGERFAVVQRTQEHLDLLSYDILVIEDKSLIKEIPLGKHPGMDFSFELFAAPNGFYLCKSSYISGETLPYVVTFYDNQGDERFVIEFPQRLFILSILGLNDGALLVVVEHKSEASNAACIRLDSSGEVIWSRAANNTNVRYDDAILIENGNFLLIGENEGNVTAFLLDKDGWTYSERVLLENPKFYRNYFTSYGETVLTPKGYAIRQSVFSGSSTQRVMLIDREGNLLGYKYFKEKDGLSRFLTFLFLRDETLCIGSHDYIWKNNPLKMVSVELESIE